MKQRKPVPQEKVRPRELSEEDKRAIVKQRQAVELAVYQVEHRKKSAGHVRNPRTPGKRTKQEKRLEARQLDYERSGLSTKQPGAYHRPGSLQ